MSKSQVGIDCTCSESQKQMTVHLNAIVSFISDVLDRERVHFIGGVL